MNLLRRQALLVSVLFTFALLFNAATPTPAHAFGFGSIVNAVKSVGSAVGGAVKSVTGAVSGAVSSVTGAIGGAISGATNMIGGIFSSVKEAATKVYDTVKNGISSAVGSITGLAGSLGSQVSGALGKVTGGLGSIASDMGGIAAGMGGESGGGIFGTIKGAIDNLKNYVTPFAKGGLDKFKGLVSDLLAGKVGNVDIGEKIDLVQKMIGEGKEKLLHPFLSKIENVAQAAEGTMKSMAGDVSNLFKGGMGAASDGLKAVADGSKSFAKQFGFDAASKINDLMKQNPNIANGSIQKLLGTSVFGGAGAGANGNGFSLGGVKFDSAGFDWNGNAGNEISKHEKLLRFDGHLGPQVAVEGSTTFGNGKGKASGQADLTLGLKAQAEGNAKWLKDGALLDAKAAAQIQAGLMAEAKGTVSYDMGGGFGARGTGSVNGLVGAEASAKGNIYLGKNGVEMKGGAEARVGAWADAKASVAPQYKGQNLFSVDGEAGAGFGVGAGVKGGYSLRTDKIGFNASVMLGPVKLGGGIYVNPVAIGQMAWDKAGSAVRTVAATGQKVGSAVVNAGKSVVDGASNFVSNVGGGIKSGLKSIFG